MELKRMWHGLSAVRNRAARALVVGATVAIFSGGAWGQCELQHILASDGAANDYFGGTVAMDGDLAVIGAYGDAGQRGSAYVFRNDGASWIEEAKLEASDGATGDNFGLAVAISGNAVIVGAYQDYNGGVQTGSAYVFRYDGSTWIEEAKLLASDGEDGDCFGIAVAISGDVAVAGAFQDEDLGWATGAAYVFRFDGSAWVEEAKIFASDAGNFDVFGSSVATDGEVLVVGAPGQWGKGEAVGAVYVFRYSRDSWVEEAKLVAPDPQDYDYFGCSVAIDDDLLLIGAIQAGFYTHKGKAFIFRYDGSTWNEEAKLLASDGIEEDYFGISVAIRDGVAVIGAPGHSTKGICYGAAYVFRFDGSAWNEEAELVAADDALVNHLGWSVATDGEVALLGVRPIGIGAAYVFNAGLTGEDCNDNHIADNCEVAIGLAEDCQSNGVPDSCDIDFGTSDDVNNDGIPDECTILAARCDAVVLEADVYQFGVAVSISGDAAIVGTWSGTAVVFRYDGSSWAEEAQLLPWDQPEGTFGTSVGIWGDVAVVGASGDNDNGVNSGSIYVFRYDGSTWNEEAKLLPANGQDNHFFGWSLVISGETIVIGAPGYYHTPGVATGCAYVFRYNSGAAAGRGSWLEESRLLASDGADGDALGVSVGISGDAVIAGNPLDDDYGNSTGSAYVFRYSDGAWLEEAKLLSSDADGKDWLGGSVAISGDLAIVGAEGNSDYGICTGSAYIFRFQDGMWNEEAKMLEPNGSSWRYFGGTVAIDGELAVVGSFYIDLETGPHGSSYLYRYAGDGSWIDIGLYSRGKAVAIDGDVSIVSDAPFIHDKGSRTTRAPWDVDPPIADGPFPYRDEEGTASIYHGSIGVDCNLNGVADGCDIFSGTSEDLNDNGIPDECEECPEDLNNSGAVDIDDLFQVLSAWGTCEDCPEDLDDSGIVDIDDIFTILAAWGPC